MLVTCIACAVVIQGQTPKAAPAMTGREMLTKMKEAVKAAGPIVATEEVSAKGFPLNVYEIKLMEPNYLSVVTKTRENGKETVQWETHNTGTKFFSYRAPTKEYNDTKNDLSPIERQIAGLEAVVSDLDLYEDIQAPRLTKFDGKDAYAIDVAIQGIIDATMYVDPVTFMPLGQTQKFEGAYNGNNFVGDGTSTCVFKKIETKAKLKPSDFDWSPPNDAKPFGAGG